jgi:AAA ATPase domain
VAEWVRAAEERAVPTIGEALGALEARLFVGREAEVDQFRRWIGERPSEREPWILNISGPGGIGKSSLLSAFARVSQEAGRAVFTADGRDLVPTPEALCSSFGSRDWSELLARINRARAVVMLDTFENLEDLAPFLQRDVLPKLDTGVRMVIAGRYRLGRAWSAWQKVIQPLGLRGLSSEESVALLARRGIVESALIRQIERATGGLPLALSLAADMVQQLGVRRFHTAREWPLVVRSLVERLLQDVDDPLLRDLLEACAVVRQFDEQTLEAVSGRPAISEAFDRLCRLSVVRPAEHGLSLHDDIQRILADDLRWRQPARHRDLRQRALAHYRDRAREAPVPEREWLVAERLYLWGNEMIQPLMFGSGGEDVYLEPGDPSALEEIKDIWEDHVLGLEEALAPEEVRAAVRSGEERAWMAALVAEPQTRIRVARTADGRAVGFSSSLPVYRGAVGLLQGHPLFGPLLEAYFGPDGLANLPEAASRSPYHYLLQTAVTPRSGGGTASAVGAAQASLLRDMIGLLASGGAYLTTIVSAERKRLYRALGFEAVETAGLDRGPRNEAAEGLALDLRGIGVEAWLEALISGRTPPRGLGLEELERELQTVLVHWTEDDVLVVSPLGELSAQDGPPSAKTVRDLVRSGLARARSDGGPSQELAYRALELAYVDREVSHERVAERLAVSRSTFYRLLKRGLRGLARSLAQP